MASSNVIDKAAAAFKKEEQKREGAKAMAEYRAAQIAELQKTERLRAMRLAREAAGLHPPALSPSISPDESPAPPRKRARAKRAAPVRSKKTARAKRR